ncbi:hypothetical protein AA313_de0210284 [Arthrobotrys entomopaga]|nr:hypothetical protein AA313_de0210284 [Arthrobotrys entomopaga]
MGVYSRMGPRTTWGTIFSMAVLTLSTVSAAPLNRDTRGSLERRQEDLSLNPLYTGSTKPIQPEQIPPSTIIYGTQIEPTSGQESLPATTAVAEPLETTRAELETPRPSTTTFSTSRMHISYHDGYTSRSIDIGLEPPSKSIQKTTPMYIPMPTDIPSSSTTSTSTSTSSSVVDVPTSSTTTTSEATTVSSDLTTTSELTTPFPSSSIPVTMSTTSSVPIDYDTPLPSTTSESSPTTSTIIETTSSTTQIATTETTTAEMYPTSTPDIDTAQPLVTGGDCINQPNCTITSSNSAIGYMTTSEVEELTSTTFPTEVTTSLAPGFSFIPAPVFNTSTSASSELSPTFALTTTSEYMSPSPTDAYALPPTPPTTSNLPDYTSSVLETFVSSSSLEDLTSTSVLPFPTTTPDITTTTTTEVLTFVVSTSEIASSSSELVNSPSDTSTSTSVPTTTEMAAPSELPSQSGVPDLILPSSMPDGYMSNPASYGNDLPTESAPLPTSEEVTSSTSSEVITTATSEMPPPTTTATILPTDTTAIPTPYVPIGTPGTGTAPDLVLPSTAASSGGEQTSTPDSEQTTTLVSVIYSTETSITTVSSSTSEEPSSIAPPTTVFVTVVVPTAPTATVTQTVYPSSISDVPETSQSTEEVISTTISYNTANPGVTSGSAPELLTSMSETNPYYAPQPTSSSSTSTSTSEPVLTSTALTAPALPTTTILKTFTITNTQNIVITTYETITATLSDIIPIPTGADVITTVFETSSIVPPSGGSSAKSPVPDFGNIVSTSIQASYPPPLLPIPQNPGNVPITTTIQILTSFAPVELPSSVSAPFTYIASTIPYPTPNANAMTTQVPTTAQSGSANDAFNSFGGQRSGSLYPNGNGGEHCR